MSGLLGGKRVIVAVTGGIAAYKAGELVRLLVKAGAEVQVVMTAAAKAFVQPLTYQALTGKAVRDSLLDPAAEMGMGHIELGRWAEMIVVAPASADAIARLCMGMADDLLTTVVLATQAPLALVPAMNQVMWENPLTQRNVSRIVSDRPDTLIWGPGFGDQACGDHGPGRMLEPQQIFDHVADFFQKEQWLSGKKVVLTAGPTRERIDPVRYISNDSSGKMGYALARCARQAGAEVVLISGPVSADLSSSLDNVTIIPVESTQDMFNASLQAVSGGAHLFIAAAAVADYRVSEVASEKIKKTDAAMSIQLVRNPDILATVAGLEKAPFCVGFAAETQRVSEHAREKMKRKKVHMMIANDVSRADIGFNSDENAVTVITDSTTDVIEKMPKAELAERLIEQIARSCSDYFDRNS